MKSLALGTGSFELIGYNSKASVTFRVLILIALPSKGRGTEENSWWINVAGSGLAKSDGSDVFFDLSPLRFEFATLIDWFRCRLI